MGHYQRSLVSPQPLDRGAGEGVGAFVLRVAGVVREWWCHVATAYWFIAERNTVTDEIVRAYPADEVFEERVVFAPKPEKDQA